ncbi:hypothetical protein [Pseudomonas izuensis]|uniref:Uncharacterized protein n=1 Tax=Pseudomonas izuensis TaxID=2684212 RepID=A0ABM7RRI7_9PSED|nr:hypothetical protein [Pseudomonas izuensis]BCX67986.1 hypothetical protein LAB08_R26250 [Pseudomonas izuensis]
MRVSENTRFPHPVLGLDTGDFALGEFSVEIEVKENRSTGAVTLEHTVTLTEPGIIALVESNQASVGCIIKCVDTFFSDLRQMAWSTGRTDFSPGLLLNRVSLRPIVWLKTDLNEWDPGTIHHEFEPPVSLNNGDIIAVGEELIINVGQAKLAPIESIFDLVKSENIPEGMFEVDTTGHRIALLVNEEMFQTLAQLRLKTDGPEILMSSIYMPAIMEVLDALRNGDQSYESLRWYQPFIAKCDLKGVSIEPNMSIIKAAQILLERPVARLSKLVGE